MISAIEWARTHGTPFLGKENMHPKRYACSSVLGICLGMQLAVIEYARHVCSMPDADSEELAKERGENPPDPLIIEMPEIDKNIKGGTMRLGLRPTLFQEGSDWSKLRALYKMQEESKPTAPLSNGTTNPLPNGTTADGPVVEAPSSNRPPLVVNERHRHRYEVNPTKVDTLTAAGLHFVGKDETGQRCEIVELRDHPWFVGVQFHPEYLSRVLRPSKPYLGFVAASAGVLPEIMKGRVESEGAAALVDGMEGVRI